jgi:hypothetical protein
MTFQSFFALNERRFASRCNILWFGYFIIDLIWYQCSYQHIKSSAIGDKSIFEESRWHFIIHFHAIQELRFRALFHWYRNWIRSHNAQPIVSPKRLLCGVELFQIKLYLGDLKEIGKVFARLIGKVKWQACAAKFSPSKRVSSGIKISFALYDGRCTGWRRPNARKEIRSKIGKSN